jgi:hypothetical protein
VPESIRFCRSGESKVDSYQFFGTPSYVLANKLKHLTLN